MQPILHTGRSMIMGWIIGLLQERGYVKLLKDLGNTYAYMIHNPQPIIIRRPERWICCTRGRQWGLWVVSDCSVLAKGKEHYPNLFCWGLHKPICPIVNIPRLHRHTLLRGFYILRVTWRLMARMCPVILTNYSKEWHQSCKWGVSHNGKGKAAISVQYK